jgi:hypothetical protein
MITTVILKLSLFSNFAPVIHIALRKQKAKKEILSLEHVKKENISRKQK